MSLVVLKGSYDDSYTLDQTYDPFMIPFSIIFVFLFFITPLTAITKQINFGSLLRWVRCYVSGLRLFFILFLAYRLPVLGFRLSILMKRFLTYKHLFEAFKTRKICKIWFKICVHFQQYEKHQSSGNCKTNLLLILYSSNLFMLRNFGSAYACREISDH